MLHQLDMEQSTDDHCHTLHHSLLEREEGEGEREREGRRGRLAAAHGGVARAQVKRNCMEALREAERRRAEDEEERREGEEEVRKWGLVVHPHCMCLCRVFTRAWG